MHRASNFLFAMSGVAAIVTLVACGGQADLTLEEAHEPNDESVSSLTLEDGLDAEERAFLTAINQHRAANGVAALKVSVALSKAADLFSKDMATQNYFSHTSLNGDSPYTRMCNAGYCYNTYKGENIAAGNAGGDATFVQWKGSSGHNQNMLNANYKVIGIGRAYNSASSYRWYWTTDFGGNVDAVMTSGTETPDDGTSGTPDAGNASRTETFSGSLSRGQTANQGPFAVRPGTRFRVVLSGSGDPDLYVRFGNRPDLRNYQCRPYKNGANETCDITVPSSATQAYTAVRGYSAATFQLSVTYSP